MNPVTMETRQLSYEEVLENLGARHQAVLEALEESPQSTAREIAVALWKKGIIPLPERNYVHPRLTELMDLGIVEPVDKRKCKYTGKMVAVYELTAKVNGVQTEPEQGQLDFWLEREEEQQ